MKPWTGETKNRAARHYQEVSKVYQNEIEHSIINTRVYSPSLRLSSPQNIDNKTITIIGHDSVTEVLDTPEDLGKVCVLNFASYKHPGGMFLEGSVAQEESLCHESTLYPVLCAFNDTYYSNNRSNTNRSLYTNRALYSPDIIFMRDDKQRVADVLTCAAPNYKAARRYHNVSAEENRKVLESRVQFVYDICQDMGVDTLIAGAWGCGVFGQDPETVCRAFIENSSRPKSLVFAIPDWNSKNYQGFMKVLEEKHNDKESQCN